MSTQMSRYIELGYTELTVKTHLLQVIGLYNQVRTHIYQLYWN